MDTAGLAALAALLLGFAAGAGLIALLLRGRLRQGQAAQSDLVRLQARLDAAGVAEEERRALLEATQRELSSSFRALSAEALDRGANRFLELADARMRESGAHAAGELDARKAAVEALVSPLRETLSRVEGQLRELETARTSAYSALTQQVNEARLSSEQLRTQTAALVQALRAPQTRGRWGELQLRRVVEIAGMSDRCDFDEQVTITTEDGQVRPDMIVRLAGGKQVVVDAKVSLAAYLEAAEATDDKVRTDRLAAHARHLRTHVDSLAAKSYWTALTCSPEFVVCFIPGEAFLAPALEVESGLLEYAMSRRVLIATPTTLVAMLRTIAYAWQQDALTDQAREVFELGRELYSRLSTLGSHVDKLGRSLGRTVDDFNRTVGSLERSVLSQARKFTTWKVADGELPAPQTVEDAPRPLAAAELVASAEAGHAVVALPSAAANG